jgi:hypothetical protein
MSFITQSWCSAIVKALQEKAAPGTYPCCRYAPRPGLSLCTHGQLNGAGNPKCDRHALSLHIFPQALCDLITPAALTKLKIAILHVAHTFILLGT